MSNVLLLGSYNVMYYVQLLKSKCTLYTYKSNTYKTKLYDIESLEPLLQNIDIIVILDKPYVAEIATVKFEHIVDVFCMHPMEQKEHVRVYTTIKTPAILKNIAEPFDRYACQKTPSTFASTTSKPVSKKKVTHFVAKGKRPNRQFVAFKELCMNLIHRIPDTMQKTIATNPHLEAVYIEFREMPHSECIIKNCVNKLDCQWSHTVVCGNDNYEMMQQICERINKNIKLVKLDISNASFNDYNNLLLSVNFWSNTLSGKKILLYQSDSFIFGSNINEFLQYDYVGAPFAENSGILLAPHQVGNGGLSLRTRAVMIAVLQQQQQQQQSHTSVYSSFVTNYQANNQLTQIPEDIYFSQAIQQLRLGTVAPFDIAAKFSIDTVWSNNSFGMHCMWHGVKQWKEMFATKALTTTEPNTKAIETIASCSQGPVDLINYCCTTNLTPEVILSDLKQEFRFECFRVLPQMRKIRLPTIQRNKIYEAVFIEFRCFPHCEFLLRNAIYKLGEMWSHTIVCGNANYQFMCDIVSNIQRNIKVVNMGVDNMTQSEYSDLLMTVEFWKMFAGEKLLIHQEDSCVFQTNINRFLEWDYIGAPWPKDYNINLSGVGNGGFSLRTKQIMIECCNQMSQAPTTIHVSSVVAAYMKNNRLQNMPEDVYFTNVMEMKHIGVIAPYDIAMQFSTESFANETAFGGHQFWFKNDNWKQMLQKLVPKKPNLLLVDICLHDLSHGGANYTFYTMVSLSKYYNVFYFPNNNKVDLQFKALLKQNYIETIQLTSPSNVSEFASYEFEKIVISRVLNHSWYEKLQQIYPNQNMYSLLTHDIVHLREPNCNASEEIGIFQKYHKVILISPFEQDYLLQKHAFAKDSLVLLHPVYPNKCVNYEASARNGILFVSSDHTPNVEAIAFFIDKYFDEIVKRDKTIQLHLVGSCCRCISTKNPNVIKYHFVNNVDEMYNRARISINPLSIGAGLKIKMLECLNNGVPILATKKANEGLNLENNKTYINLELLPNASEYAEAFVKAYQNVNLLNSISVNQKQYFTHHFTCDNAHYDNELRKL